MTQSSEKNYQILIVEDEAAIRQMVAFAFAHSQLTLLQAIDVAHAQKILKQKKIDLILLDWMLPGISGVRFAKQLRRQEVYAQIPIIMLTAKSTEEDKIKGFSCGIDDYVVKPFSPRELIARVQAVLRRTVQQQEKYFTQGNMQIHESAKQLLIDGQALKLGPLEYRLMRHFMLHPQRVFSRQQLLDSIWGYDSEIDERTVDVHIRRLRRQLANFNRQDCIQTVRGSGYRFELKK